MSRTFARSERTPAPAAQQAVSTPGDRHEVEADRAAEAVVRGDHGFSLSRLGGGAGTPRRRQEKHTTEVTAPGTERVAEATDLGGGAPLDAGTRSMMEARLGHDFGRVRVHNDAPADQAARGIGALAYTSGTDIAFASGQYEPHTPGGQHLIAHELAHVVQQDGHSRGATLQRRSIGESIGIFFGLTEGKFTDEELDDYLKAVTDSGEIQGSYDSDNKARAIVVRWKAGDAKFNLVAAQKILLIKEMLDGPTLDDDELAILDLLKLSDNTDLRQLLGPGGVTLDELDGDFHGAEQKELDAFIEARFTGGRDAVAAGTVDPQGDVPADAPAFAYDFAAIRAKIEGNYTVRELVAELSQLDPAQMEQAQRDLIADRNAREKTVAALREQYAAETDPVQKTRLQTRGQVAVARQQKTEDLTEALFRDVALTESKATLLSKTAKPTKDQKAKIREALKPEVQLDASGAALEFQDTVPGETKSYEQKLRELMPHMIQAYWDGLVKDKGAAEHADATKTHTLSEMEDIGNVAKDETDTVFGSYYDAAKHPKLKADTAKKRGNIHDLFADLSGSLGKMSKGQRRALARQLLFYFFQANDDVRALNDDHHASPAFDKNDKPTNDEAKVLATLADEFTATEAQVKKLNEIDRNWEATAQPSTGDINIQLFKRPTVDADRDYLWDMFQTFIHEYMHTLVHPKYDKYAATFGDSSNENNTLMEGMDCVLAETVWTNVQPRITDPALRLKVEGPVYSKLPPMTVRPPSRARYPSFTEALKVVSIVGIRNVYAAYFMGDVEKIGA